MVSSSFYVNLPPLLYEKLQVTLPKKTLALFEQPLMFFKKGLDFFQKG